MIKCFKFTALVLSLSVLLSACSSTIEQRKPALLIELDTPSNVSIDWTRFVDHALAEDADDTVVTLRRYDETLYALAAETGISAVDSASGDLLWSKKIKEVAVDALGVSEELVLVVAQEAELLALDRQTGDERWRVEVPSEVLADPQVADNIVVVRTGDGRVTGMRASDGQRLWTYERSIPSLMLRGYGKPVIAEESVLVGFDSGYLVRLNLRDGKLIWERRMAIPSGRSELARMVDVDATPILKDDVIYAMSFQGRLLAVDLFSGQVLWSRDFSAYKDFTLDDENLYLVDEKDHIVAIHQGSGATVWRQEGLEYRDVTHVVSQQGKLLLGDFEGYLHWLSPDDGRFVARFRVDRRRIGHELIAHRDRVFSTDASGVVTALVLR